MEQIMRLVEIQLTMLLYLGLGALCRRTGIINEVSEKNMSNAITNIIFPCMIFHAMMESLSEVEWEKAGAAALVCVVIFTASFLFGKVVFRKYPIERRAVLVFGMLISNAAFIGLPLVTGMFGTLGIFYTTIYMTVSRVFLWSAGVSVFPAHESKNPVVVVITNPNSIAMFVALAMYFLSIPVPHLIMEAASEIGGMSTIFCMTVVGSLITNVRWSNFTDRTTLYFCFLRLILIPLVTFFGLWACGVEPVIVGVMTLLVSTPAPTLGSVLSSKYGGDKEFASSLVLVSTLLSMATIPVIALLYA